MENSGDLFGGVPYDSPSLSEFVQNSEEFQDSRQETASVHQSLDYESMLREIDASHQKYNDLEEKFVQINSQLSICTGEINRLKSENNEQLRKIRDLEQQLKFADEKRIELSIENTELINENWRKLYEESEYDALKEHEKKLLFQVQQKKSELENKNDEIRSLTEKNIKLSERNSQLTALITQEKKTGRQNGKLKSKIFLWKAINEVLHYGDQFLLTLTQLCLLGTFLKTVITMWFLWKEDNGINSLKEGFFAFVVLGRLIGTLMVLFHLRVKFVCGVLFILAIIQDFISNNSWDLFFLIKNMSVLFALFLLVLKNGIENRNAFEEISVFGQNKANNYLQLVNQIAVVFIMVLHLNMSLMEVIRNIITCAFIAHVIVGSETKSSILLLILWLIFSNYYINI